MNDDRTRFWMVWNSSCGGPTLKHHTYESAHAEAGRLARKHPGDTLYVLMAIERAEANVTICRTGLQ